MVAVPDALELGEPGLRARTGQGHGVIGADGDTNAQVAAEEEAGQTRPTLGGDRWWLGTKGNAGYGRLLNEGIRGKGRGRWRAGAVRVSGYGWPQWPGRASVQAQRSPIRWSAWCGRR